MIVRFTGGPLDGLQREMGQRDIPPVLTVRAYIQRYPDADVTRYPRHSRDLAADERALYAAQAWYSLDASEQPDMALCVEYIHQVDAR